MKFLFIITVYLSIPTFIIAQGNNHYTLFHPVPKSEMHEFETDRPSETGTPFTVDAGHFQFESDLVYWNKYSRTSDAGEIKIMNGVYKLGLLKSLDFQLGIELLNAQRKPEGTVTPFQYGATTMRLKYNVQGNDGDKKLAFAVVPFVMLDKAETGYGLEIPFSYELSPKLELSWQSQIQFDHAQGETTSAYEQTLSLSGDVVGDLAFFLEGVGNFSNNNNYFLNGGFTYDFTDNIRGDIATHQTLNHNGPAIAYIGFSFRL
jgi:hypothetical protein